MQEKAGQLLRRYERELEKVSQVAASERERLRTETAKLEAKILDEARAAAAKIGDEGRKKIEGEANASRFDLGRQSEQMRAGAARCSAEESADGPRAARCRGFSDLHCGLGRAPRGGHTRSAGGRGEAHAEGTARPPLQHVYGLPGKKRN
jgi:hypothetical protein